MPLNVRLLLLGCAFPFCLAAAAGEGGRDGDFRDAADLEAVTFANLPGGDWDMERMRDIGRSVGGLPDAAAAEVLWTVACASPNINSINFFSNALGSPSPGVRKVAASILVGDVSPDSRRLVLNTLATERDSEVIQAIVQGVTRLSRNKAVRGLIDIMLVPGIPQEAVRASGAELRRLTRAEVLDDPGAWRDWWLDNEDLYR